MACIFFHLVIFSSPFFGVPHIGQTLSILLLLYCNIGHIVINSDLSYITEPIYFGTIKIYCSFALDDRTLISIPYNQGVINASQYFA